jgi:uncharacterized membrane protein YqjE
LSGTTHSGSGFVRELGDVCSRVLEGLAYRVDLVALELKEEKERLVGLLVAGIAASLCAFMAFLVLNVAILAVGSPHRGAADHARDLPGAGSGRGRRPVAEGEVGSQPLPGHGR